MIAFLFNIASVCFFAAEMFSLHRKWRAQKKMDSTSLRGVSLHLFGNLISTIASFAVGAYIACTTESILVMIGFVKFYLKLRWVKKWKT